MLNSDLTNRHPAAIEVIKAALRAVHAECIRSPTATLSEGHLKAVLVESLLRSGYSVLEGSSAGSGKLLSMVEGAVHVTTKPYPRSAPVPGSGKRRSSPDVRVESPCRVYFEIQARSMYGTQDTLFTENVLDDFRRLRHGLADVFLLAADAPVYDALRGVRSESRGRKAKAPELLAGLLPPRHAIPETPQLEPADVINGMYRYLAGRAPASAWEERVVVAFWKTRVDAQQAAV